MADNEQILFDGIIAFIRQAFDQSEGFIPLHAPTFSEKERHYVLDAIDSTFVSSVGAYVNRFEEKLAEITGAKHCVVVANGTEALHVALLLGGVKPGDLVITQPVSFVATANAIKYCGAEPVFLDVDRDTMGLSPSALTSFIEGRCIHKDKELREKETGRRIAACVPMHTFGHPCRISSISEICQGNNITLIEDSAESLGSYYGDHHTGRFGRMGTFSFNGNKIVTCGGGGAIVTDDEDLAKKAKHLTTTAKLPHKWDYVHDQVGYNYRMPNLNAALGLAQLERLEGFIEEKRALADEYKKLFSENSLTFMSEPTGTFSNYWLNAVLFEDRSQRDRFLQASNEQDVMTRPLWRLLNCLEPYQNCLTDGLPNARWLEDRLVNLPSSVRS
jgi:aminotransferase in exopolysaccharide biosynthesis